MNLKLKLTGSRILIVSVAFLFLSFFAFCIALSRSPSSYLNSLHSSFDARLSGLSPSGTSLPNFSVSEDRLFAPSVKAKIVFDPATDKGRVPEYTLSINKTELGPISVSGKDPVFASLPLSNLSKLENFGFSIDARCLNPIPSNENPQNSICTRVSTIQLLPRFLLMLPNLDFAAFPVFLIFILLLSVTISSYQPGSKEVSLWPAIITAAIVCMSLSANRYDYWVRSYWAILFFLLVFAGFTVTKYISLANTTSNIRPAQIAPSSVTTYLLLAFVVAVAAYLRFDGLDFGLPGYFHPDEGRKMKIIRGMVERNDLNPHYFRHPTFLLYGGAAFTYVYTLFTGTLPELPTVAYLGRSVSAVLGSLSVLVVFLIARLIYGNFAGLVSAALLAVTPLHVVSSRYIKEDASMLFFCLLSLYFALYSLFSKRKLLFIFLSAFFAGVSTSSKYSGLLTFIFTLVPIANLIFLKLQQYKVFSFLRQLSVPQSDFQFGYIKISLILLASITLAVVGFIVVSPYSVLDYPQFIEDFSGEKQHMERGHSVAITALSYYWSYHFKFSILPALTDITAFCAVIACGFLLYRRNPFDLLILCSIFLFYLPAEWVKAKPEPQPERYIVPCIPFLCIALAAFLAELRNSAARLKNRLASAFVNITPLVLIVICIISPALYTSAHTVHVKNDTRNQARDWIRNNVAKGSTVIIDWQFYSAPQLAGDYNILEMKTKGGAKILKGLTPQSLRESGADYFVASSFFFGRYLNPLYRSHNLSKRYKSIMDELKPVAIFDAGPYRYGFHNPTIYIFALK